MPDTQPTIANFGDAVNSMTAEQRAAVTAVWSKAGYAPAEIEKALAPNASGTKPATAKAAAPEQALPLSEAELRGLETLKKHWTGDPAALEQLEQTLRGRNDTSVAVDDRTGLEKNFDAVLGGVTPERYPLNGLYVNRGDIPLGDVAAFDAELRGALAAMQVPAALGRGIAEEILASTNAYDRVAEAPEGHRELWKREQRAELEHIGRDTADNLTRWASHALARVAPETRAWLLDHGALETAAVVLQLAEQGKRIFAREQMARRAKNS